MESQTGERNKILIIGTEVTHVNTIAQKIAKSINATKKLVQDIEIQSYPLLIDTKYYTADVELWVLEHSGKLSDKIRHIFSQHCEALIITYDIHKPESFEMIQDWSGFVDDCNPSINLCYGHNIQNKSPIEILHHEKEREEWCIENGFEYVFDEDRKPSTQFNDEEDDNESAAFKELFGIDRIVEALQTNMWPNMTYKTEQKPHKYTDDSLFDAEDDFSKKSVEEIENQIKSTTTTTQDETDVAPEKQKLSKAERRQRAIQREQELLQSQQNSQNPQNNSSKKQTKKSKQPIQPLADKLLLNDDSDSIHFDDSMSFEQLSNAFSQSGDIDQDMDAFEKAMNGLGQMRGIAKEMPDTQRRDFAAKVVMQLMKQLDLE